jgi:bacterioferritin-associated ferredoxin
MIVCLCRRVSDRDIARAAQEGCASFEELQSRLGVATGCGACGPCARELFDSRTSAGKGDAAGRTAVPVGVVVHAASLN